jgi:succinylglutamate desuccinylase
MRLYIVVAQHGDEIFGLSVARFIHESKASNCRVRIGHPEAVEKGKRFLETDLNRSFNSPNPSKEALIAVDIVNDIREYEPDYIIDIHTSTSNVGKVTIIAEDSLMARDISSALGMEAIVIIPKEFSAHSLIGACQTCQRYCSETVKSRSFITENAT